MHANGWEGRWEQASDGCWWAFYSNIGPGEEYGIEHPYDSNWWTDRLDADPENYRIWACRHGWYSTGIQGKSNCMYGKCDIPHNMPEVTDEEMEDAGRKLAELVSSLESK